MLLLVALLAQAQNITVQGTVISATDNEPLIGAVVITADNEKNGVTTDFDGKFTLNVPEETDLTISYVGYKSVTVKAQPSLTVSLDEDAELLDEVVVVGYSAEKKSDLTGSVSVVKMKDVADTPTGNVIQSLQGRVAGMTVTTDGTPGGLSTGTSIRRASSFRGDANGPLYVIDGVMTRENPGTILSSNDVESIQVLKDAASASIYGAQAANGVIIITTKRAHYMPDGAEENAVKQHPAKAVYDVEGVYVDQINDILGDAPNMMRLIENNKGNKHEYWRVFGNAYLQIEPVKHLIVKTNFGVNYYNETNKTFEPKWLRDDVNKLSQSTKKNVDWVWTNTAQYNADFGRSSIMALVGIESKRYHFEEFSGYGTGLAIEDPNYLYLGNVTAGKNVGAGASNYSMFSGFGKLNYTFDNKYLASFTIRRDASSRLYKDHNYDWILLLGDYPRRVQQLQVLH